MWYKFKILAQTLAEGEHCSLPGYQGPHYTYTNICDIPFTLSLRLCFPNQQTCLLETYLMKQLMHAAVKVSAAFKGHLKSSCPSPVFKTTCKGGGMEANSLKRDFARNEWFGWECYTAAWSCGKRWPHKVSCICQVVPDFEKEETHMFFFSAKSISKLLKLACSSVDSFRP